MWFLAFARRRPRFIAAAVGMLVLAGATAAPRIPVVTPRTAEGPSFAVHVGWPSAPPREVEAEVTRPVEQALRGLHGVRRVDSESRTGEAILHVALDPRADLQLVRLATLDRLALLGPRLPAGAGRATIRDGTAAISSDGLLLECVLRGHVTSAALTRVADDALIPALRAVAGVAIVSRSDAPAPGLTVSLDEQRLRARRVASTAVVASLQQARVGEPAGVITTPDRAERRLVTLRDVAMRPAELSDLPIVSGAGRPLRVGDLASVVHTHDATEAFLRVDGIPAVTVEVHGWRDADAVETAARVRAAMLQLGAQLPPGIKLHVTRDQSRNIAHARRIASARITFALLATVAVLVAALRQRAAVGLAALAVGVTVAMATLVAFLAGLELDWLSLSIVHLAMGMLVAAPIAFVLPVRSGARIGAGSQRRAIVTSVGAACATVVIAAAPLLTIGGTAGTLFRPALELLMILLSCAAPVAAVLAAAFAGRADASRRDRRRLARWEQGYRRLLLWLLGRRGLVVASASALAVAGTILIAQRVPRVPLRLWDEKNIRLVVSLRFPSGIAPEYVEGATREFEALGLGRAGVGEVRAWGLSPAAQVMIAFDSAADHGPLAAALQASLTQQAMQIGGAFVSVAGYGLPYATGGSGGGISEMHVKLTGYNFLALERLAASVASRIGASSRVRGVSVATSSADIATTRVAEVMPDRARLARYGLTTQRLVDHLQRVLPGRLASERLRLDAGEVQVAVKLGGARLRSVDELARMQIAGGGGVRLRDVARVIERNEPGRLDRDDQSYVRVVTYEFAGPDALARQFQQSLLASIDLPPGFAAEDLSYRIDGDLANQDVRGPLAWSAFLLLCMATCLANDVRAALAALLIILYAVLGSLLAASGTNVGLGREAIAGCALAVSTAALLGQLLVRDLVCRGPRSALPALEAVRSAAASVRRTLVVVACAATSAVSAMLGEEADAPLRLIAVTLLGGLGGGTLALFALVPLVAPMGRARAARTADQQAVC